jgi:hypothetical protein
MEFLIYALGSAPEQLIKYAEGEETTDNEMEAYVFATKADAEARIETLTGTTDFWGTRPPRPR